MSDPPPEGKPLTGADASAWPQDGAFIVEFRPGAAAAPAERLDGRVEHVASGMATLFGSADELLGFVRDVLRSAVRPGARRD